MKLKKIVEGCKYIDIFCHSKASVSLERVVQRKETPCDLSKGCEKSCTTLNKSENLYDRATRGETAGQVNLIKAHK